MKEPTIYEQLEISKKRAYQIESRIILPLLVEAAAGQRNIAETIEEIYKNPNLNEKEKLLVTAVFCTNFQTLLIQLLNPGCVLP